MSQQFDEKAVKDELDRLFKDGDINHWQYDDWANYFSRWQFNRDRAVIEKLEASMADALEINKLANAMFHDEAELNKQLRADKAKLEAEISRLKEIEWMYNDLCK